MAETSRQPCQEPTMTATARRYTTAYVGANQLFYYAMGFAPYETGTWWA